MSVAVTQNEEGISVDLLTPQQISTGETGNVGNLLQVPPEEVKIQT